MRRFRQFRLSVVTPSRRRWVRLLVVGVGVLVSVAAVGIWLRVDVPGGGGPQPLDGSAATAPPAPSGPSRASTDRGAGRATGPYAGLPPLTAPAPADRFGLGLLIADRGNGRLLIVDGAGRILWQFPAAGSLPPGQSFAADDAFLAPDGRTIVANDEEHQVIDRIDVVSRRVIWQYGHYGRAGSAPGYLHTPDDAYPLGNGDIRVADISNCRILELSAARRIVRQWGRTGVCRHAPPSLYARPNGDTPLPDGGMLVTEIRGSRVVRLDAQGQVVFDVHVPTAYPSDAQLLPNGDILVVDYSNPGSVLEVTPRGRLVWRYRPTQGSGRLDHPSLAIPLPDGTIAVNDDFRHRVVVIDPRTSQIVWQYGHTDVPSRRPGYLSIPDGIDLIPLGTRLSGPVAPSGGPAARQ